MELHSPLSWATLVYCDNISAVYLSTNLVQHQRTKHFEIDIHFVRERVAVGDVRVLHVPTTFQFSDIFTQRLEFRLRLVLGPLGLRVYRVAGPCVGRGPTPRLYNCNPSLEIN
jgi:hypothetical protein